MMSESSELHPDSVPRRGDERTLLEGLLDLERRRVLAAVSDLSEVQARAQALPATDFTIGGILKHLASGEDEWFQLKMGGVALPEPWTSAPKEPDWAFRSARHDSVARLVALYEAACQRSRETAREFGSLDETAKWEAYQSSVNGPFSLRRIYLHVLEHTVHHLAHIEVLRDAID